MADYHGIVDTHAHMDDPVFRDHIGSVLEEEKKRGVERIIQSGSELPSSRRSVDLAEKYDMLSASVGIYPNETEGLPDDYIDQLREMASSDQVCAIGEIGMDLGYEEHPPVDVQEKAFRAQLELAIELDLPVVIHDRDDDNDTIRILKDYPEVRGAIHRIFSPLKDAETLIDMGFLAGIGPQVTWPDSEKLLDLVREMPMDRILLETDAPFLPTYDKKGQPALPSMIAGVAEKVSELRKDVSAQEVITAARENAKKLYDLPLE